MKTRMCETVTLTNGLCLITHRNKDGSLEAQHDNPVCREAAQRTVDVFTGSDVYPLSMCNEIVENLDLRVRIRDVVSPFVPSDVTEKVACALEQKRPWDASRRYSRDEPDIPF